MSINNIIKDINKKYKSDILGVGSSIKDIEKIPFSSVRANYVTRGGIPVAKMTEFFGTEGSGKTTSALDIISNFQKMDKRYSVYVDLENTLDKEWGEKLGVNFDKVILIKPDGAEYGETILDMTLDLIRCGDVGLLVIDSIPFLLSKAVMEADLEQKAYAGNSALITTYCSKVIPLMNKFNCTVLMLNQVRDKIGVAYTAYSTCGGRMLKHSYSFRVQFSKGSLLDDSGNEVSNSFASPVGNIVAMKIEKNKVSKPDRKLGQYILNYASGIDSVTDSIDLGIFLDVIKKSGAWYSYGEVKAQGRGAFMKALILDSKGYKKFLGELNGKINN